MTGLVPGHAPDDELLGPVVVASGEAIAASGELGPDIGLLKDEDVNMRMAGMQRVTFIGRLG